SKTVTVLLNTTAPGGAIPNFAAQRVFPTGTRNVRVTSGDFNSDGKPDLVFDNSDNNAFSVLLNAPETAKGTIIDNSSQLSVSFASATHTVNENSSSFSITVTLS